MSQNSDLVLVFIVWYLENNYSKGHKKLPVFSNKIKTKPYIKNLRHISLHKSVFDVCVKFHYW